MYCVRGATLIIYRDGSRIYENLDLMSDLMVSLLLLGVKSSSRVLLLLLYILRTAASSLARLMLTIGVIPVTGIVHSIYIIVASIASRAMTVVGSASSSSAST